MAGITLEVAESKLQLWLDADAAVARNQEFWVENRKVTRTDAREIRRNIDYWQAWVYRLGRVRGRVTVKGPA